MTLPLLYIDPGTGSALFSILIGVAATAYFLGRALFIKLKVVFSGGRVSTFSTVENPYVIYNEGSQYSNVFKSVLDEFEARGINMLYLSSDKSDPLLNETHRFVRKEFIGEENKAFLRLNMLKANVVLMTTPGLDVYQLKRSKGVRHYAHVLHAPSDAVMYRLFGIDYFDSILLTGDYQANDIRVLEQKRSLNAKTLITVGCTYLDVFAEKIKQIPKEENRPFTVLVSPSWGPSAILSRFGEKLLEPLIKTGFRIIVRPHPQSKKSETGILEKLEIKYKASANLIWDYERENIYSLAKSDVMISDFSGIIFDYVFLFDKPVLYVMQGFDLRPYDADDLGEDAAEKLWQFKVLKEIGIPLKEEDFASIDDIIKNASDSGELRQARQKARDTAWQYRGEAGKRITDYLLSIGGETVR
ncbi:MAG: CDP-glycerol glycerophosphotransferase family protein [Treponema sp.]|nr:CDP-glycerol glycerophosphotransferase family protein [Treponema sp.]